MSALQMTRHGETGYQLKNLIADKLPKRQCESLLYHAIGETDKSAAEHMNCAPGTVRDLRREVHFKCGTHNGPALITKSFELGFLRFASIMFACLIGIAGNLTLQSEAEASEPTHTEEQMRFRNRPQRLRNSRSQRNRPRSRSRSQARQIFHITTPDLNWDDETTTLLLEGIPLHTITENQSCADSNY